MVTADKGAHVDLHDIAFFKNAFRGGDSVNDLVIDADACASGEAAVAEEGGAGTAGLDMTADAVVELFGGNAFAHHLTCQSQSLACNAAGCFHQSDLFRIFNKNHVIAWIL